MTESAIEHKVVNYCRSQELLTYKFTSPSQRGVPDRIILGKGKVMFLELKQYGKRPTVLQLWEIKRIQSAGHVAVWADNHVSAIALIREHFATD
jgi:hypothetical protein